MMAGNLNQSQLELPEIGEESEQTEGNISS